MKEANKVEKQFSRPFKVGKKKLQVMSESEDDLEWQPPTEAEKKVLAARRERSDKVTTDWPQTSICTGVMSTHFFIQFVIRGLATKKLFPKPSNV